MEIVEIGAQHDTFIYDTHVKNNLKIYHLYLSPMPSAINADKNALVIPHAHRLTIKTGQVAQHQRSKLSAILHLTLTYAILDTSALTTHPVSSPLLKGLMSSPLPAVGRSASASCAVEMIDHLPAWP